MRIHLVTPAPPGSLHGNRITALRWQRHLRALGHRVRVSEDWSPGNGHAPDLLIALHASRSHAAIAAFRAQHPHAPIVLVLTGTDLYRDLPAGGDGGQRALASIAAANRLVVLQDEALMQLPTAVREKAQTIHQSVPPLTRLPTPARSFLVTVIGHLREEKDPLLIVDALAQVNAHCLLRAVHLGKAMTPDWAERATQAMAHEPRYRWLGERPHRTALRWLARSHLMVISSRMEGGAHVVSEAIAAGVPVLASDIPGNRGLLGADYPGTFAVGDAAALAQLLMRAHSDAGFLQTLAEAVRARQSLVLPATERQRIAALIDKLRP